MKNNLFIGGLLTGYLIMLLAYLLVYSCDTTQAETSNDELVNRLLKENRELKIENAGLKVYKSEMDKLDSLCDAVRQLGYTPHRLIVRKIQRTYTAWGLESETGIKFSAIESSAFNDKRRGVLGELGGFQILPSTLKAYIARLGGDTAKIDLRPYEHWSVNTEWSAYILYQIQQEIDRGNITKQKTLDWARNWNQGKGMK